ncbi:hypothetical protein V6N13_038426 [Hibiscus sabdariffa]
METPVKYMFLLAFLLSMTIAGLNGVVGTGYYYGPCGKHDIEKEAEKLEPCAYAAQHRRAPVSEQCCTVMEKKVKNPACLCAVLFSQTAYNAGVRPEIAVSIPKRCNIADRPAGYKCGGMETPVKYMFVLAFLVSMTIAGLNGVVGTGYYYGPCGKHDIEKEAEKLEPCTYAAQHWRAPVSERCCTVMEKKVKNPACLCAVLFSQTAYNAGVRPEIAVSIPKRCNIANRPPSLCFNSHRQYRNAGFAVKSSSLSKIKSALVSFNNK